MYLPRGHSSAHSRPLVRGFREGVVTVVLGIEWDLGVGKIGEGRSQRGQHRERYGEERGEAQVCEVGAGRDSSIWENAAGRVSLDGPWARSLLLGEMTQPDSSPQGRWGFPGHRLRDSDRRQVKPHSGRGVHLHSSAPPASRIRTATSFHEHIKNKARQKPLPGWGIHRARPIHMAC